jgi:hypothetical protein
MILYHGNTWHGAYRRETPGVRLNLSVAMCRNHIVTQEMLARNNERFAYICGQGLYYGYGVDGPNFDKVATTGAAHADRFA